MKAPMDVLEPLLVHMRVDLRRGDIGVAEHLLDHPEIGAVVQQVRGEGVPQQVRVDFGRIESGQRRALLHDLPHAGGREFRAIA